ncbi:hypothetical protein [Paraburkholderia franconis]|uniref:hypothetical protein n=1 Tax=Paraburkholderia franconis TaxID=2654983 RepID=UPI00187B3E68|nr:hypothetical protein [Paraburkholderia franconis]
MPSAAPALRLPIVKILRVPRLGEEEPPRAATSPVYYITDAAQSSTNDSPIERTLPPDTIR